MFLIERVHSKIRSMYTPKQKEKILKFQALRFRRLQHIIYKLLFGGNLKKLALAYYTDKWGVHKYAPHYETYFTPLRKKKLNILEIGIGGYDDPEMGGGS